MGKIQTNSKWWPYIVLGALEVLDVLDVLDVLSDLITIAVGILTLTSGC